MAAVDAVRQWRYAPYLRNGEAEEFTAQITVDFALTNGNGNK
jgi:outer membrane biosynthesis protein TonB